MIATSSSAARRVQLACDVTAPKRTDSSADLDTVTGHLIREPQPPSGGPTLTDIPHP